jgi:hypothetical protein
MKTGRSFSRDLRKSNASRESKSRCKENQGSGAAAKTTAVEHESCSSMDGIFSKETGRTKSQNLYREATQAGPAQAREDLQQRTRIQAERKTRWRLLNLRTRPESYGRQLVTTGPDALKLKTEKRTGRRAPLLCCRNQIGKSTRKGRPRNEAGRQTRPVSGFKTQSEKTAAAGESNRTLLRI